MFARYGYPNDLLGRLARAGARAVDVPVRPVYGPGWRSGIRVTTVIYPVLFLLLRAFLLRLYPRRRRLVVPSHAASAASGSA
jgi:hypothetical protein